MRPAGGSSRRGWLLPHRCFSLACAGLLRTRARPSDAHRPPPPCCPLALADPTSRYHQYKFIVDGEWRHDDTQPYMPDPLGNVNNWLFVRKPDNQQAQG